MNKLVPRFFATPKTSMMRFTCTHSFRCFSTTPSNGDGQKLEQNVFKGPKSPEEKAAEQYYFDELRKMSGLPEDGAEEEIDPRASAAKSLSLSLLQTESGDQVLQLFDREYLRTHRLTEAYAEELSLILYFLVKNLSQAGPSAQEEGTNLVKGDLRFKTLMQFVFGKLHELEYDYVVSIVWSLGICVSAFGLQIEEEDKLRLLSVLNQQIDGGKVEAPQFASIPSLAFSITCFFNDSDMNDLVTETVAKLSHLYGTNHLKFTNIFSRINAGPHGHPQLLLPAHVLGPLLRARREPAQRRC